MSRMHLVSGGGGRVIPGKWCAIAEKKKAKAVRDKATGLYKFLLVLTVHLGWAFLEIREWAFQKLANLH